VVGALLDGFGGCCADKIGKVSANTKTSAGAHLSFMEMKDRFANTLRSLGAQGKRRKEERCGR
jgi:hypothetical protein